jgi:hypothetical protein
MSSASTISTSLRRWTTTGIDWLNDQQAGFNMLQDKDRIFTNLYGMHDRTLAGARRAAIGTAPRT